MLHFIAELDGIDKTERTMLVKHIVVVAMIVIVFWFNAVKRVGQNLRSSPNDVQRMVRFRRYCNPMTVCGVLVLVLTAYAQFE